MGRRHGRKRCVDLGSTRQTSFPDVCDPQPMGSARPVTVFTPSGRPLDDSVAGRHESDDQWTPLPPDFIESTNF